jgi:hypothetical protein
VLEKEGAIPFKVLLQLRQTHSCFPIPDISSVVHTEAESGYARDTPRGWPPREAEECSIKPEGLQDI